MRLAMLLGVLIGMVVMPAGASAADPSVASCREVVRPVPASVLGHTVAAPVVPDVPLSGTLDVAGQLCMPKGRVARTVLVLLPGVSYDRTYWDFPYEPATYSFVDAMSRAGYATLALDPIGHGRSVHPLSALVTMDAQAAMVHGMIGDLRAGRVGEQPFPHVALVGHAYGTATAWLETAQFNDADAVVGTAWSTQIEPVSLTAFFANLYPAVLDPRFSARGLDPGYLTTQPGARRQLYDLDHADPAVIATDEATKDTITPTETATSFVRYVDGSDRAIRVPQFLVNGRNERFFCGVGLVDCRTDAALTAAVGPSFRPQACFRAAVIPDAGHDLNLQRNAPVTFATIRGFLDRAVGPDGDRIAAYRAACDGRAPVPVPAAAGVAPRCPRTARITLPRSVRSVTVRVDGRPVRGRLRRGRTVRITVPLRGVAPYTVRLRVRLARGRTVTRARHVGRRGCTRT